MMFRAASQRDVISRCTPEREPFELAVGGGLEFISVSRDFATDAKGVKTP
jgi:hypothetical protein